MDEVQSHTVDIFVAHMHVGLKSSSGRGGWGCDGVALLHWVVVGLTGLEVKAGLVAGQDVKGGAEWPN